MKLRIIKYEDKYILCDQINFYQICQLVDNVSYFWKNFFFNDWQAFYVLFEDDHRMKLAYFIAIAGLACVLFAIAVPTMSSLRIWLVISSVFSLIYLTVAFVLALRDGMHISFIVQQH